MFPKMLYIASLFLNDFALGEFGKLWFVIWRYPGGYKEKRYLRGIDILTGRIDFIFIVYVKHIGIEC